MSIALPAAPAPAPRRQVLIATVLASAAGSMVMAGLLATWLKFRAAAPTRPSSDGLVIIKDWMPKSVVIPEVVTNLTLFAFVILCVMAQWAVYSAKRAQSTHRSLAIGTTFLMGLAALNSQIAVWNQMKLELAKSAYNTMFYTVTGAMVVFIAVGLAFSAVAFFRSVGGRDDDKQVVTSHALYWYFCTAAYVAMWFVVYVQK
jgi:heme/copper-type cytochrome/quinol oxidase subunit 3